MLLQINRMDLAETWGEEEEVAVGEEEEEVGDERRSGCGSLKFTHRMGADPPPCLHASRAGQLLGSVRRCFDPPICTIDKNKSRNPGLSPGFSPGSSTSPESRTRTYSASTSSPCGRKRATAAALLSAVSSSGCPSGRWSSAAEERSLLLLPRGRRGVKPPRRLLFKWRRLPRGAGRGAAAADRHAAALAWSRRYAAAVGFCTKNHCILVGIAGVGACVRPSVRGEEGGVGCGYQVSVSKSVASLYPKYCSRGLLSKHTLTHSDTHKVMQKRRFSALWPVRAQAPPDRAGESPHYPTLCFLFLKSPYEYFICVSPLLNNP